MDILYFFQQISNPIFDILFENITLLFNETLIIAIVCYIYWCYDKRLAHKIAISYFFSGILIQSIKLYFRIPRPWILDKRLHPKSEMIETATGYSFPSGHTQTATATSYSLLESTNKKGIKIVLLILPFLMMFSRMYVLVHSPMDVLVSFLISATTVHILLKYLKKDYETTLKNILVIMLVLSIFGFIYTISLTQNSIAPYSFAHDSIKMMGSTSGFAIGCLLEQKYLNFKIPKTQKSKAIFMILGLTSTIIIKLILNQIQPSMIYFDYLQYFILLLWISYLHPLFFNKYSK